MLTPATVWVHLQNRKPDCRPHTAWPYSHAVSERKLERRDVASGTGLWQLEGRGYLCPDENAPRLAVLRAARYP